MGPCSLIDRINEIKIDEKFLKRVKRILLPSNVIKEHYLDVFLTKNVKQIQSVLTS